MANHGGEVIDLVSDEDEVLDLQLNYTHNAFRPPQPNQNNSTQPARDGFSRNTGEDVVAICPSCNRELAYDPDEIPDSNATTTPKTSRNKRDKAEHHFWAVKACGHVSCMCPSVRSRWTGGLTWMRR